MNLDVIFGNSDASLYVWGSFALCLALMAAEVARLRCRIRGGRRHEGTGARPKEDHDR
jgi:hypothetical protein